MIGKVHRLACLDLFQARKKEGVGTKETAIGGASVSVTLFDIGRPKDVFRLQMRKFFLRIGCLFFVFKP